MAAALVATACGSGGDGGGRAALSEGPSAPPTTATAEPSTTLAPASTSTTRAGVRVTTTLAPAGPGSPTTLWPAGAPPAPPAAGTYRYDTRGQSTFGAAVVPFPAVTSLVVDPPTGTRQRATRDLRDAGTGVVLEYVLDYRADGVHLVSLGATVSALLFSQREELRPPSPVLLLPTGAAPGTRRELDIPSASGATAHLVLEVQGPAAITAAGRRTETTAFRLTATLAGQLDNRIELTVWLAAATRLWAQERLVAEARAPSGGEVAFRTEYTATLIG